MPGTFGQFGGECSRTAPDIEHPRARARQLPQEQPVIVGIVIPVQQPHAPILPLPRPADAETAGARPAGRLAETTPAPAYRHRGRSAFPLACARGWGTSRVWTASSRRGADVR